MSEVDPYFPYVCDQCGLCPASSPATPRRYPSIEPTDDCKVVFVLNAPSDVDTWSEGQSCVSVEIFKQLLITHGGWTAEELAANAAFCFNVRAYSKQKLTAVQRRMCGAYTTALIQKLQPELVVVCSRDIGSTWGAVNKVPKLGRVAPLTEMAYLFPGRTPVKVDWPCQVMTVQDPIKATDYPDMIDMESYATQLRNARGVLMSTWPVDPFAQGEYEVVMSPDRAIQILDYFCTVAVQAVDIETAPSGAALDPYNKKHRIIGVGLSDGVGRGFFIPAWHKDNCLADIPDVLAAFVRWAEADVYRPMHNGVGFDALSLTKQFGVPVKCDFDTMVADRHINENRSHTLKSLGSTYFPEFANYEDSLEEYFVLPAVGKGKPKPIKRADRDYEKHLPLEVLGKYGCVDVDLTMRLFVLQTTKLLPSLPAPGWGTALDLFTRHDMRDAWQCTRTSVNGNIMDPERVKSMRIDFKQANDDTYKAVMESPEVDAYALRQAESQAHDGLYYSDGKYIWAAYHTCRDNMQPLYDIAKGEELEFGAKDKLIAKKVVTATGRVVKKYTFSREDVEFSPSSAAAVKTMCTTILKATSDQKTKSGGESWDKSVLTVLAKSQPFVAKLLKFKQAAKIYTTYARPLCKGVYQYIDASGKTKSGNGWLRDDDLVHCQFLLAGNDKGHGTKGEETGGAKTSRKSARDPNLQNVATHSPAGKRLRQAFTSRFADARFPFAVDDDHAAYLWENVMTPAEKSQTEHFIFPGQPGGGVILKLDYSQLELRLFAIIAGIEWMLNQYLQGKDLHLEMAIEAFGLDRSQPIRDARNKLLSFVSMLRSAAKSLWFGPIYGESAEGMHKDMVKKGIMSSIHNGQPITLEEVEGLLEATYAKMPEFEAYKHQVEQDILTQRCVYTVTGRRRYLPHAVSRHRHIQRGALRQAVNTTIQGPGADVCAYSFYTVGELLRGHEDRCLMVNTVHDSLDFDLRSECLPEYAPWIKGIMEDPPFQKINKREAPIGLLVDAEAGPSAGALSELLC